MCMTSSTGQGHLHPNSSENAWKEVPNGSNGSTQNEVKNKGPKMPQAKNSINGLDSLSVKHWYLDEKNAKTVAARKFSRRRILGLFGDGCDNACEVEPEREREELNCRVTCMHGWGGWGACSKECGAHGTQTRHRGVRTNCRTGCPGDRSQTHPCNIYCPNGGTPTAGGGSYAPCVCTKNFQGDCCQVLVSFEIINFLHSGDSVGGNLSDTREHGA